METERYRVLIVDDNPGDRLLYRLSLDKNHGGGFEAAEASAGREAIELCRRESPDCIVLDYNLPDMDGIEFMSEIKNERDELPCAVVMLTGAQDERIAVRAMKSGAIDYIPKTERVGEVLEQSITGAIEKFQMRRQIEEQRAALAASEHKYRALMESSPQLVWVADDGGTILYANSRWLAYTGQAEPPYRHLNEVISPEDHPAYQNAWKQAIGRDADVEVEVRLVRPQDGSTRWHLLHIAPIRDFPNAGAQWLGTCTDIENNKQAERVIQETQKWESIGMLAAGIAHDFNNLLVGILGGASYVCETLPSDHTLQPIAQHIVKSGERAAQLTRQMLAYAGKEPFFAKPLDLSAAVHEAWQLVHATVPRSTRVTFETPEGLPLIETDPNQIQHLIVNLMINASEAIPAKHPGTITVRTYAQECPPGTLPKACLTPVQQTSGTFVILEIQDSGVGMDGATVNKIFDPFFTTKFTGRGLGLAAVQGIVRRNRGCITIESEPGKGSTFRVMIPARNEKQTKTA